MSDPVRFEQYVGSLPYRDHACSVDRCSLMPEHDCRHAEVSLSGMVLDVWDEPELGDAAIEVVERLNRIRDDLIDAMRSASDDVRDLQSEAVVLAHPGLAELLELAECDIDGDVDNVGLSDDPSTWGTELQDLGARRLRKIEMRAAS